MASGRGEERTSTAREPWAKAYLGLAGAALLARLALSLFAVELPAESQATVFSWPVTLAAVALGGIVLALSRETHLVSTWNEQAVDGTVRAALLGAGLGAALVGVDLVAGLAIPHVPVPAAFAFYAYGAVLQELLVRLIPTTATVWLASLLTTSDRWQRRVFWTVAVAVSLFEPVGVLAFASHLTASTAGVVFAVVFAVNVAAAHLYWRYGFQAAVAERLALYAVWHVAYAG